jgi:hypothetical protein
MTSAELQRQIDELVARKMAEEEREERERQEEAERIRQAERARKAEEKRRREFRKARDEQQEREREKAQAMGQVSAGLTGWEDPNEESRCVAPGFLS